MRLAAPVPLTGRYAMQGRQMAAGLTLWAHRSGAELSLDDDQSDPQRAVELFQGWESDIVLGPYGSDSVREVATSLPGTPIWNHGAAADDVQRLPNVISLPSPSSRYLVTLARALAWLRPGASVAVVTAPGRFADYAWQGLLAEALTIDVTIAGRFRFDQSLSPIANNFPPPPAGEGRVGAPDVVLAIGPLEKEIALFRQLRTRGEDLLLAGVSPGLSSFPQALGSDPDGFLAPVQWHPDLGRSPHLGPSTQQVLEDARSLGLGALDYVAAQAYAAALIADECHVRNPADPAKAARDLHTSTFFGAFALDPKTGEQRGHEMAVIQWRRGRQELIAGR
jgi:ABC-type branched-subunit amino acid transport system substrate-binding protein